MKESKSVRKNLLRVTPLVRRSAEVNTSSFSMTKKTNNRPKYISLYTGAGGLDIGFESAGFESLLCVESDPKCLDTLRTNRPGWKIATPGNIFEHSAKSLLDLAGADPGDVDLIVGGPPCQPFSKAAYWHKGTTDRLRDPRAKTIPKFLEIVSEIRPKIVVIENVSAIGFRKKSEAITRISGQFKKINKNFGTRYNTNVIKLNAAHYGVPQKRERIFIVAHREGKCITSPERTHGDAPNLREFVTAWDALADLQGMQYNEDLQPSGKWAELLGTIPEGQNYLWHTPEGRGMPLFGSRTRYWSFLLKLSKKLPSWTIPATYGPANGPFHWENRRLSSRELARLQSFPDSWEFVGNYREKHAQIGNAVPPLLGEVLGRHLLNECFSIDSERDLEFLRVTKLPRPRASRVKKLPKKYLSLVGDHSSHPGTGKGPRAISWSEQ